MKSKVVAYLLWYFLGWLGIHRVYCGKKIGLIWPLTFGYFGIGWFLDLFLISKMVDIANGGVYKPEVMDLIHASMDAGEEVLKLCDFTVADTQNTLTAVLSNRYVRFMQFKKGLLDKKPQIVFNASIPIHKVSAIVTSESKQGPFAPNIFGLEFWWEGKLQDLITEMVVEGRAFASELRRTTLAQSHVLAGGGLAAEIKELAALAKEGILSDDELARAKELFLGKPRDKQDDAVRLLRDLHALTKQGVVTQSEFNMKKWDILSKKQMS